MIKKLIFPIVLMFAFSCQNKQTSNSSTNSDSTTQMSEPKIDSPLTKISTEETIAEPGIIYSEESILIPHAGYRISTENEIEKILKSGKWLELYKDEKGYKIAKAQYNIIDEDEEPCSGMPTQSIETERNTLALFNINGIKTGKIDSVAFTGETIKPNQSISFDMKGKKYELKAEGFDPLKTDFRNIKNPYYKLSLAQANAPTRTIHLQKEYNDTETTILFIGDLNNDGEVDFILSSPRDYEEERILIILSGDTKTYEGTRQFDC